MEKDADDDMDDQLDGDGPDEDLEDVGPPARKRANVPESCKLIISNLDFGGNDGDIQVLLFSFSFCAFLNFLSYKR